MVQPLRLTAEDGATSAKLLAVAKLAGLQVQHSKGQARTPCGIPMPELHLPNGSVVKHTNAILRRLAQVTESGLMGRSFAEEAQVDSWLEWSALEVDHTVLDSEDAEVAPLCEVLEAHLKTRTFLVGQRLTIADISTACSLRKPVEKKGIDEVRKGFPNFMRWFLTVVHHMADAPAAAAPAKSASAPAAKAAPAPAAASGGGDEITAVGNQIRELKAKLKADGLSGKKIDANEEVKALVAKLTELKAGGGGGAPAAAAAPAPKAAAAPAAPAAAEEGGSGKKDAKKAAKEEEKRKKEEEKKKREEEAAAARDAKFKGPDVTLENFMDHPFGNLFIQSQKKTGREWTEVGQLVAELKDKTVWLRARVHNTRKQGNKLCFITLRQDVATVQAVCFGPEIAGFAGALPDESVVDVYGKVSCPEEAIKSCTQSAVELQVERLYCIGRAQPLPLQLADAGRSELEFEKDESLVRVNQDTRLDNRVIDLRTVANQAIFRIQSGVCTLFREFLLQQNFQEIHTPKLIGGASEGGADVFEVKYFEGKAFLAQSPQLYKQMALMTDMPRVFEIAPVFRSERSFTHRHMTEFTGLDLEMTFKDHYHEVLDVLDGLFNHIFAGLNTRFAREIEAVRTQYPFEPLQWKYPCKRLTFKEAIGLLRSKGPAVLEERLKNATSDYERKLIQNHLESVKVHDDEEDISTEDEKILGVVMKQEFNEELYIIDKFPKDTRPFYTMPDPFDDRWTNAYDVFLRGEEITSGAQRIHDAKMLADKAESLGVAVSSIQKYVDAFKYGSYPHGGAGIGMERVVMLFLNLHNIRKSSMFPRDPKRLTP